MNWEKYEEVVKDIYKALGEKTGVTIECYGRNCKCKGKSDVEHQIDVITSHSDGLHTYRTAIECKYWDKKINKDIVMKVQQIVSDCNFHKGVVVSRKGATPDGKKFAKQANIELVELRKPLDEDWKGRIRNIEFNIKVRIPEMIKMENIEGSEKVEPSDETIFPVDFEFVLPSGKRYNMAKVIQDLYQNDLDLNIVDEVQILTKTYPSGTVLENIHTNKSHSTGGVNVHVVVREIEEKQEIRGEDHVWLIMKNVFEDKSFFISKDGKIRETE